jgi:Arc/MetJ family transcription regulator
VSRTDIDTDDELIALVMRRYRVATKREAVDPALRALVGQALTREDALGLEGSGWEGDPDTLRAARLPR